MRNPTLTEGDKIKIMLEWGDFLIDAKQQPEAGIAMTRAAAALAPLDVETQMNLVNSLLRTGKRAEALTVIAQCRKIDRQNVYQGQLNYLENLATTGSGDNAVAPK
jgi:hypothetical protein